MELIVTQWDVNVLAICFVAGTIGINSYIVGCKYARKGANNKVACGINSYIVGCKLFPKLPLVCVGFELIVTQWDVNEETCRDYKHERSELIVTQWDVNLNTVPCCGVHIWELIVTQWDVNVLQAVDCGLAQIELIVTQWDVNQL